MNGVRARLRHRAGDDRGFTLIEVTMAMGIFTVFVAIFIASVVQLSRGTTQAMVTAQATSGVLSVFQKVDRQVRWSDAINFPGEGPSGDRFVEFRLPAVSSSTGVTSCVQWRYSPTTGMVSSRRWTLGAATLPEFTVHLDRVIDDVAVDYPFSLIPASLGGTARQGLALRLDAGTPGLAGSELTSTYIARNSSLSSPSNVDNDGNGVSDTPVCNPSGYRP